MLRITALLFLLLPATAAAQTLQDRLQSERGSELRALIETHRMDVKPVVQDLVTESVRAAVNGNAALSTDQKDAAVRIATAFEDLFGERSLSIMTAQLTGWDRAELVTKLEADSLLSAAVEIRSSTPDSARVGLQAALEGYRSIGDATGEAECLGQLGYVSWFLDRASYIERNLEALAARRAVDDRQLIGNTLSDLGLGNRDIARDLDVALDYYAQSEQLRREMRDTLGLSRVLPNKGIAYERIGAYSKARDAYLEAGQLSLAIGDTARWIGQVSNTAGLLTDYADRHSEALAILLGLEKDLDRTGDARARAVVMSNTGIIRRRLGDYEGAVEAYREAIRLSELNGFDDLLAKAYNNLGVLYIFLERSERAIPMLQRALNTMPANEMDGRADALLSLASAHFQLGEFDEARQFTTQASAAVADPVRRAKVLKLTADTKVRSGSPAEAVPDYEQLLALAERLEVPLLQTDAYFGLGEATERSGDPDRALGYYEDALQTLETARGQLYSQEDKSGYLAQTRYLYEEVIHFLSGQAIASETVGRERLYAERAFLVAERGKSRGFLDQMAEAFAGVREGVDPELQSDLGTLSANMEWLRGQLAEADPDTQAVRIAELKDLVSQMESEYERVEREMRERNPRFAALKYPVPIDVAGLQSGVLKPGEVLLQYALGDSSSTLWAVTRDEVQLYSLPVRSEIEDQIDLLRFALKNPTAEGMRVFSAPARRLFETLVSPASDLIEGATEIIVVPDGSINYVPFEVLLTSDEGESFVELPYFVRAAPISYVQSASVLQQIRSEPRSEPTRELLAIGDPAFADIGDIGDLRGQSLARLPFSGIEVSTISDLFDSASRVVLLDEEATEQHVREALLGDRFRFVHFATHGLVNDDRPDNSALALAGNGSEALLQVGEILNLRVDANLVVLSACETGLGQLVKGEGVVGLTRAFMYAGTPSVVVSLWSVSDRSTSSLMQAMYRQLVINVGPAQSLRTAKLALMEEEGTAHPFHWAPFVLVGRGD